MTTRYRMADSLTQACIFLDLDPARVLRASGLPADWLEQGQNDVDGKTVFRIWSAIAAEADRADTALELAMAYAHGPFVPPVLAFSCADTVFVGWERLAVFKPIIAPMEMKADRDDKAAMLELSVSVPGERIDSCMEQFEMVYLTELVRTHTGRKITPLDIETQNDWKDATKIVDFLGVTPKRTGRTRLILRSEDADLPLISRSKALWDTLEPQFTRQLQEQSNGTTMVSRVRRVLVDGLPGGCTTADQIAKRLNVSKRSLQRRLTEEGSSVQMLLNEVRSEMSEHYLRDSDLSVPEISHLLGFRDTSSFFRAFHGWTGTTPGSFRTDAGPNLH